MTTKEKIIRLKKLLEERVAMNAELNTLSEDATRVTIKHDDFIVEGKKSLTRLYERLGKEVVDEGQ